VRLVDREQRDLALGQQPHRGLDPQPLGREVEQVELARQERGLHPLPLAEVLRRVEEPRAHAQRGERVDLVLHQRDQRRDDHPDPWPDEGGDLVAQRLAAAGGHEHERIAARDDVLDDLLLTGPERVVTEHPVQDLKGGIHVATLRVRGPTFGEVRPRRS
jgi:hypothetical protein